MKSTVTRVALTIACGLGVALVAELVSYSLGASRTIPSPGGFVAWITSSMGFAQVFLKR